jgi:hypothetical protein
MTKQKFMRRLFCVIERSRTPGFCHFCHRYWKSATRKCVRTTRRRRRSALWFVPTCPESRELGRDASNAIFTGLSRLSRVVPTKKQPSGRRLLFEPLSKLGRD